MGRDILGKYIYYEEEDSRNKVIVRAETLGKHSYNEKVDSMDT